MSASNFLLNFARVKASDALSGTIQGLASWDPKTSSEAEMRMKEQDLDKLLTRTATEKVSLDALNRKRAEAEAVHAAHMAAIDRLGDMIKAENDPARQASLNASLETLVGIAENETKDLAPLIQDATEQASFVAMLTQAAQDSKTKLLEGRQTLANAARDLERARHEEEMAHTRSDRAREMAGLTNGHSTNGVDVATNAMKNAADQARARASAANAKAAMLTPSKPQDDPNIAAAMAAATGATAPGASMAERIAALKQKVA